MNPISANAAASSSQARDQDAACPEAVHRESDRHLGARGGDAEDADRETELGISDVVHVAQHRKQRRQEQHVEVAGEVGGADDRDGAGGAAPVDRRCRFDGRRHDFVILSSDQELEQAQAALSDRSLEDILQKMEFERAENDRIRAPALRKSPSAGP